MQKGSPYIDEVNEKLQLLQQLGLIETWIRDAVSNASNCGTLSQVVNSHKLNEEASLILDQIDTIFFALIAGLLMSIAGKCFILCCFCDDVIYLKGFVGETIKGKSWIGRGERRVLRTRIQAKEHVFQTH